MGRKTLAAKVLELAAFHNALAEVLAKTNVVTRKHPQRDRRQTSRPHFQSGESLSLSPPKRDIPSSLPSVYKPTDDTQTDFDSDLDRALRAKTLSST